MGVHLHDAVGEVPGPRFSCEVGMGQGRVVDGGERHIGEERSAGLRVALHEAHRAPRRFGVDQPARLRSNVGTFWDGSPRRPSKIDGVGATSGSKSGCDVYMLRCEVFGIPYPPSKP